MPELPSVIGRYRILRVLGRGGMGLVYLARDPALDRTVVIKVTQVDAPAFRRRFLLEARAAGCLKHETIVTIFDAGEFDGQLFIVMEYVEGRTFGQIIECAEQLPMRRRLRLMRELCDGLAYAHARGVVHRDVKPDNLMVRDAGGGLAILDFGIARIVQGDTTSGTEEGLTAVGDMIGTPHYMAPEQVRGETVDYRCDVFSAGLVFYELLSYRRAFSADTLAGVIYKILHEDPPSLAKLDPRPDPAVIRLVERAMAKDPDARYQDLRELRSDLDAVMAGIEADGDATVLRPPAQPRAPDGEQSGSSAVCRGPSADATAAPGIQGTSAGTRRAPWRFWSGDGFAGRKPSPAFAGVLLGGVLLAAGGMWLASPSGGESDPGSAAPASARPPAPASARPPALALGGREPGVEDDAVVETGGGAVEDAGRTPPADAPERDVDELLAEANRAFGEGRYGDARRLFREAHELSAGGFRQPADGVAPARPERARGAGAADGPETVFRRRE